MTRRVGILLASLVVLVQTATIGAAAAATRQGVDGNTYVSPSHGWSIAWDERWSVDDEQSEDGYDLLVLADPLSTVYFESYEGFDGDPDACVDDELETINATEGFSDVEIGEDGDGDPLRGSDRDGAYAVYTFTVSDDDGVEFDVVEYSDCRTLTEGEAVLEISLLAIREAYNEALPAFQELLEHLSMPGEDRVEQPDEDDDRDAPGPADDELTEAQALDLVEATSEDLTGFWSEIFAGRDLFYVAPFYVVVEDETEVPCTGGTTHPGSGSFYCPLNQTIYFDMSAELRDAEGYGRASVYYTLGHESGHDVQMQLGVTLAGTMSVEMELEADCMAGSYLATVVENGDLTEEEFFNLLELVESFGDPDGMSATDERSHGLGSQRVGMVLRGYYEGIDACGTF